MLVTTDISRRLVQDQYTTTRPDLVVLTHVRYYCCCHQSSVLLITVEIIPVLRYAPNFDAAIAEKLRILKPKGVSFIGVVAEPIPR
jgi:hypothetical protein